MANRKFSVPGGLPWYQYLSLTILCVLLTATNLHAQKHWQSGSVTLSDGTPLTGEINPPDWGSEIQQLEFRKDATGSVVRYSPEAVSSFRVADVQFISRRIAVDGAPGRFASIKPDVDYPPLEVHGFLNVLVAGSTSLYVYTAPDQRSHYFLRSPGDEDIVYLPYHPRVVTTAGAQHFRALGGFRRELAERLVSGCPTLSEAIGSVEYTERGLRELLDQYYDCTQEEPDYVNAPNRGKLRIGVVAGVESIVLKNARQPFGRAVNDASGISPSFGLTLRYTLPILGEQLSVHLSGIRASYSIKVVDDSQLSVTGLSQRYQLTTEGYYGELGAEYKLYDKAVKLGLQATYQLGLQYEDVFDRENIIDGKSSFVWPTETIGGNNVAFGVGLTAEYRIFHLSVAGHAGRRQGLRKGLYSFQRVGLVLTCFPFQ